MAKPKQKSSNKENLNKSGIKMKKKNSVCGTSIPSSFFNGKGKEQKLQKEIEFLKERMKEHFKFFQNNSP